MDTTGKRRYHSPLREKQQEETRELILEALGKALVAAGPVDLSLPNVAERAGVNVRTVYRHFGGREQLVDALQAHVLRRFTPRLPATLAELLDYPPTLFALFDEHAPWVEAMLRAGPGADARGVGKAARVAQFQALTAPVVAGLPSEEAAAVQAIFKHLVSAETWYAMRRDFGLDGPTAGRAVSRTLRALVASRKEEG
jgi:AcrR family transcriptional regulator